MGLFCGTVGSGWFEFGTWNCRGIPILQMDILKRSQLAVQIHDLR